MHRWRRRRGWRHEVRRCARVVPGRAIPYLPRLRNANRKALLLGIALASTLLGSALTPTPAAAVACIQPASPNPINDTESTFITCVNTVPRTNAAGSAIYLHTTGTGSYINLYNSFSLHQARHLHRARRQHRPHP